MAAKMAGKQNGGTKWPPNKMADKMAEKTKWWSKENGGFKGVKESQRRRRKIFRV